ncbi:probable arabinose 5-phosphate isomerase [Verrucomicrobiota bacterium]|nr:probable arabinose 5-phosphate isomerase [Verrucomicrobiota bacterium]
MTTPSTPPAPYCKPRPRPSVELATRLDGSFTHAVDLIAAHPGKVVLCGVGKSGLIGQKIAATLCSTGTPRFSCMRPMRSTATSAFSSRATP